MKMLWPSDSSVRKQNVQDTWTFSGFCLTSLKIFRVCVLLSQHKMQNVQLWGSTLGFSWLIGFHSNMTHTGCVSAVLSHFACWNHLGEMHFVCDISKWSVFFDSTRTMDVVHTVKPTEALWPVILGYIIRNLQNHFLIWTLFTKVVHTHILLLTFLRCCNLSITTGAEEEVFKKKLRLSLHVKFYLCGKMNLMRKSIRKSIRLCLGEGLPPLKLRGTSE